MSIRELEHNEMGTILVIGIDGYNRRLVEILKDNYKVVVVNEKDYNDGMAENILPDCVVIDCGVSIEEASQLAQRFRKNTKDAPLLACLLIGRWGPTAENAYRSLSPFNIAFEVPYNVSDVANAIKLGLEKRKRKE